MQTKPSISLCRLAPRLPILPVRALSSSFTIFISTGSDGSGVPSLPVCLPLSCSHTYPSSLSDHTTPLSSLRPSLCAVDICIPLSATYLQVCCIQPLHVTLAHCFCTRTINYNDMQHMSILHVMLTNVLPRQKLHFQLDTFGFIKNQF